MSTERPPLSAAEIAAGQVAAIVTAAEHAAAEIAAKAERDARERERDVEAGHRRLLEELRPPGVRRRDEAPRPSPPRAGSPRSGPTPLDDVEIPSWVEGE